jgi:hypothetical protein
MGTMPFKEGGSTRDILLGSLMLEQYGSMRRYHWYKGARH